MERKVSPEKDSFLMPQAFQDEIVLMEMLLEGTQALTQFPPPDS